MAVITIKNLTKEKSKKFANVIYLNFINLTKYPKLNHNKKELSRLLTSSNTRIYLLLHKNKIASYLVGEFINLDDGRLVFFINYIFTSKLFRDSGLGSTLIKHSIGVAVKNKCDGIMLICDVENEKINNFYLMRGFMPDVVLRRYDKHDVLYRKV